ncbi:MAG: hypothetical protein ACLQBX_04165 [Candidatus Limnocylindrales bacterium]
MSDPPTTAIAWSAATRAVSRQRGERPDVGLVSLGRECVDRGVVATA